jgi:hypothetical protein
MDPQRFATLSTFVARAFPPRTRRGLLRLTALAALLIGGAAGPAVVSAEDDDHGSTRRRRRRRTRHKHDRNRVRRNKQHQHKPHKKRKPQPTPPPGPPLPPVATCLGPLPPETLQQAIDDADPGDTLTLCPGTWLLPAQLEIAKDLTLRGGGVAQTILSGQDTIRPLAITAGAAVVTVRDLTITKGKIAAPGGGIHSIGTLTLIDAAVTECEATTTSGQGGGIVNYNTLHLVGTVVTDNSAAESGGGIHNEGVTVTLDAGSSVTGNFATSGGGGIYNLDGTVTLDAGSSVTGNSANSNGGGIRNNGGTVTLADGAIVCGNTAPANPDCFGPITGTCPQLPPSGICPVP